MFKWLGSCCCPTKCPPCPDSNRRGWYGTPIPGCPMCGDCPPCPTSPLYVGYDTDVIAGCPKCVDCPPCEGVAGTYGYPSGGPVAAGCSECPPPDLVCKCNPDQIVANCCFICSSLASPGASDPGKAAKYYLVQIRGVTLPAQCPIPSPCLPTHYYQFTGSPNGDFLLPPSADCTWSTGVFTGMTYTILDDAGCTIVSSTSNQITMQLNFIRIGTDIVAEFGYIHEIGVLMFSATGIIPNCCADFTLANENIQCSGGHANGTGGTATFIAVL